MRVSFYPWCSHSADGEQGQEINNFAQGLIANPWQNKTPTNTSGIQVSSHPLHVIPKNPLPERYDLAKPGSSTRVVNNCFHWITKQIRGISVTFPHKLEQSLNVSACTSWLLSSVLRGSHEEKRKIKPAHLSNRMKPEMQDSQMAKECNQPLKH